VSSTFYLEIVTPNRKFFSGEVESVTLKSLDGELGILKGHIPMVAAVDSGRIQIHQNGEWLTAAVSSGFSEVKEDRCIILVDSAEWPHEIDVNRALAAKERAEERLRLRRSQAEYLQSKAALSRATARLKVTKPIK
jgi:F-type H+-transporting ATPase subunit epsilon